jgi:benzaldehyde dehydrogenase (NAD)
MSVIEANSWSESLLSGEWNAATGEPLPVVEPATGNQLGETTLGTERDVSAAAQKAAAVKREWAHAPYEERAAVLRRAGDLFAEHAADIEGWLMREGGSVGPKAQLETHIAQQECYEAASLPSHPLGQILATGKPRLSLARRLPAGVVAVISPFNFPLILSIRSVAPALALGSAVILKPDPRTAVGGGLVLARIFAEAGLPDGVLQVLPGGAQTGGALIAAPEVRVISFTGSTAAGREVGEAAGRLLKRAHLELGGNSALIVLEDADLEPALSAAAFGSFIHQGQVCMTTGRHIVHASLAEQYVEGLAAKAAHLPVGDPTSGTVALGPVIDERQRDRIHEFVTSSRDAGATIAAGGTYDGLFYSPTVVTDVSSDTPVWAQEVFGPVAPIARFSSFEEAAQLANDTEYGLSLGILTRDVMKGMALADRIRSGIVHINDQTVDDEAVAPFGGVSASGTGSRFGGADANIEAFTETQWLTVQGEIAPYPF